MQLVVTLAHAFRIVSRVYNTISSSQLEVFIYDLVHGTGKENYLITNIATEVYYIRFKCMALVPPTTLFTSYALSLIPL